MASSVDSVLLYHEKQVRNSALQTSPASSAETFLLTDFISQVAALCGQHCLNTLLQGPYFSEVDLAQVNVLSFALISRGTCFKTAASLTD